MILPDLIWPVWSNRGYKWRHGSVRPFLFHREKTAEYSIPLLTWIQWLTRWYIAKLVRIDNTPTLRFERKVNLRCATTISVAIMCVYSVFHQPYEEHSLNALWNVYVVETDVLLWRLSVRVFYNVWYRYFRVSLPEWCCAARHPLAR